ncbi:hypothetical protein DFJ58DRAFT_850315 [Suillus subalutaceus]|uniref:uncharacterized protein n=1 Tax=Suillus subalutaceus TaxID=48586 RepID=UPI001B8868A8|nr:uncharacterized protein DFJ58DRAFT_850315 [Suillus subalutaceus]KAG1817476.1 hypothetical protein DFJ58DRAFT_850315 [Suillus subalutaceus]
MDKVWSRSKQSRNLSLESRVLGVGCRLSGVGCWVLGVGVLGVGCWVLGVGQGSDIGTLHLIFGSWNLAFGIWHLTIGSVLDITYSFVETRVSELGTLRSSFHFTPLQGSMPYYIIR